MEIDFRHERYKKYQQVEKALHEAKEKHPDWPDNIFEQLAILQEEAGEITKAVLQYMRESGSLESIVSEVHQTAAMCIRFLENLPGPKQVKRDPVALLRICIMHQNILDNVNSIKISFSEYIHTLWNNGHITKVEMEKLMIFLNGFCQYDVHSLVTVSQLKSIMHFTYHAHKR